MKKIFVDLDDIMCHYKKAFIRDVNDTTPYPQSKVGFFANLKPIDGAIEAFNLLGKKYDMWILSSPSYMNPSSYTEKRLWVEKYLGLEMCKKLILTCDKSLIMGDYLIDDTLTRKQLEFPGEFIHYGSKMYPDWQTILDKLL